MFYHLMAVWGNSSVVKYTSHKITMLTTLSAQFHSIKYIHNMIQPSLPSIFRAVSSSQTGTQYWLSSNSSYPPPQSLMPTTLLSVFLNLASPGASYKWHHTIFVPLSQAYFTGHNVLKVYSCCGLCQDFLLFKSQIIFCCICGTYLVYPVIHPWTFGLFPLLVYYQQRCNEHGCANSSSISCFWFFWIYA